MAKKTHEQYVEELSVKNPTIEVVEKYINAKTKILHKCKICYHEWFPVPYNVLYNGSGCPVCAHKCIGNAPEYKNSIWASEYKEYFSNYMTEEQMKMYMPNSLRKIELVCPQCNHKKYITPSDLLRYGFGCLYCSDGISYPNKFARAFVDQLPIYDIQNEYSPDWCIINGNKCRYDIYFKYENQEYIIEMDGELGHGNRDYLNGDDTVGILRDKEKDILAKDRGIVLIRIDSRKSEREYIKNSILNSELNRLFNLADINWEYCDKQAVSSNIIKASTLWNQGLPVKSISEKLHVYTNTVAKYLIRANKLGLCDYTKQKSIDRGYKELSKMMMGRKRSAETCKRISNSKKGKLTKGNGTNSRKVIRLCDTRVYDYLAGAADDNNIHKATMIKYCKIHKGFMYYDEWLKTQDNPNEVVY